MKLLLDFPTWWFWNPSGHFYIFVSGVGGDLGYLAILATMWRHLNCATHGCWRVGRHPLVVDGVTHRVCTKCHPSPGISRERLAVELVKSTRKRKPTVSVEPAKGTP